MSDKNPDMQTEFQHMEIDLPLHLRERGDSALFMAYIHAICFTVGKKIFYINVQKLVLFNVCQYAYCRINQTVSAVCTGCKNNVTRPCCAAATQHQKHVYYTKEYIFPPAGVLSERLNTL